MEQDKEMEGGKVEGNMISISRGRSCNKNSIQELGKGFIKTMAINLNGADGSFPSGQGKEQ